MAELTEREFWLIRVYFKHDRGFGGSHRIHDIVLKMMRLLCGDAERIIDSLIQKKVLSLSPDKQHVKFTDYGLELYTAMERAENDWEDQPIIRISNIDRDQILIRAGETFRANRVVREILGQVSSELCVIDAYLGPEFFDLLEDVIPRLNARILTSDKAQNSAISAYKAFRNQYPTVELRVTAENKIHDRYILWDNTRALHLGHSLKDLGKKDTQINVVQDPRPQFALFEDRWKTATVVT
jgi:hypothetical protein